MKALEQSDKLDQAVLQMGRKGDGSLLASVQRAMEMCADALEVERASTWLFSADGETLSLFDVYERSRDEHSSGLELERRLLPRYFRAIENEKVLAVEHVESDPRTMEFAEHYTQPPGVRSVLDGAVRLSGEVVGVVCFEHLGDPRDWTSAEATFSMEVASLVAQWLMKRERDQAMGALEDQSRMLLGLAESQGHALSGRHEDMAAWFHQMLASMLQLSESEYRFIGSVEHDDEGAPFLRTHAITNIAWDAASRAFYEEHENSGFEFRNLDTLFGAVLTSGELVIANEPDTDVRAGGRPHGHPPLDAFAGIPLIRGDHFIGMVGLANKPGGYAPGIEVKLGSLLSATTSILGFRRDQSELEDTRHRLAASEAQRRAVQQATGRGDWQIDFPKGTIVFSEGGYELLGLDPDGPPMQAREFLTTFYHEEDAPEALTRLDAMADRPGPIDVHRRVVVKSGEVRWIHITGLISHDESGQPVAASGQYQDVTARIEGELELKRALSNYRDLFDLAPSMYVITQLSDTEDSGPTIVDCNAVFCRTLGYEKEEVVGRRLADFYDEASVSEMNEQGYEKALTSTYEGAERSLVTKAGTVIPTLLLAVPVQAADGEVTGTRATFTDISELRTAQEKAHMEGVESARIAEELTQLIDTANAPIFGIDANGLVNEWNQTAERITGFSKAEVMDEDLVAKFIRKEYRDSVGKVLSMALNGKETANYEFPLYSKAGQRIELLLNTTTRRDAQGAIVGVVGVGQDITERKRTEVALQAERDSLENRVLLRTRELRSANLKLARAGRMKDEFLASMSHELRTPLNAILGMSEALAEGAYGELTDTQVGQLRFVHESGEHLLSLITDILDVAKIESGHMELDRGEVRMSELLDAALRLVGPEATKKRLSVTRTDDPAVGMIWADGRRLKQILVNLLSNAVKFTPEGGKVGVEVQGDTDKKTIRMSVWDEGIGISENDQQRLFDSFVQLDSGLNRSHEGSGLGLVIAKRMTELHGGTLDLESRVGEGSRFTVTIPWREGRDGPGETSGLIAGP